MTTATSELVWLKSFLAALAIFHNHVMHLFCDTQAALHLAKNPVLQGSTKHMEINSHFVCERYHSRDLDFAYIPSKVQLADVFTKAHGEQQLKHLRSKFGIVNLRATTWGALFPGKCTFSYDLC